MNRSAKLRVWKRDKYRCQYCGIKLDITTATVDHVIARCNGGHSRQSNLVTACRACNFKKSLKEHIVSVIY